MRKFYSRLLLCFIVFIIALSSNAQLSNYAFTQSTDTYTPLTAPTVVATATGASGAASLDDVNYTLAAGTIPFSFNFNGSNYTGLVINSNGYVTFGATPPSATATGPISSTTAYSGAIAAIARDLNGLFNISGNTGEISYEVVGSAPNREFVIQWKNFRPYSSSTSTTTYWRWNFQIRLKEDNSISIVYDLNKVGTPTSGTGQVGLRGASNTDYNNRTSTTSWTATNPGASNSSTVSYSSSNLPPSGLTFSWAIAAMDLSLESITVPASPCPDNNVTVFANIRNTGLNTIDFSANNATITINTTGASTQTLNVTLNNGTLAPNGTMAVPVFPNADLTAGGLHTFNGILNLTGDGNSANDDATASTTIIYTATTPVSNNFTGYTGSNLNTVFPGWTEGSGATRPTGTTSAWVDQTGLGGGANVTAKVNLYTNTRNEWIVSPRFLAAANSAIQYYVAVTDFGSVTDPAVMGSDDRVSVMVSTDCGITWTELKAYTIADNLTPSLTSQVINLGAYAGQNIMVAFKAADGPVNDAPDYDFHIDDINIADLCSGTPASTTTVASANPVCLGSTATLSLTGLPAGIAGFTYVWESSPDGSTWSTIPGANASTLTVLPVAALQYRATVTCTNGGASSVSLPVNITINSLPAYASLPYSQDFEAWIDACNTTDRPGSNWVLFPAMSDSAWRRDDQGASAAWTGTSGSYSPAFTTGAHSARFHSYNAEDGTSGKMDLYINLSTDLNAKLLKFDYRNNSGTDILKVFLSEDGGQNFTQVGSQLGTQTSWGTKQFVINSNSATAVIRLEATSDFGFSDIGVDNLNVLVGCTGAPAAGTLSANGSLPLCAGGSIALNLTGHTSTAGITLQWQSSPDNLTWTDIGGVTGANYSAAPSASTYYRVMITCTNTSDVDSTASVLVNVNNPVLTSTTPATRCGIGTATLSATTSVGNVIKWYADPTGVTPLATGNSYTTPTISSTTTYYAVAESGIAPLGAGNLTSTSYESPYYHLFGGKRSQYLLLASELTGLGLTAGNIGSIGFYVVSAGTTYNNFTISMKQTTASVMTTTLETGLTTVYTAASVTPIVGINNYVFAAPFVWDGSSNVIIDICWNNNNTGGTSARVKMNPTGFVSHAYYRRDSQPTSVVCGTNTATGTTSNRPQIYFDAAYCQGTRVAVVATVNTPPDITILPAGIAICQGESATLSVTSPNAGYSYSWSPGGQTGTPVSVSPLTTTTYILTATDNSGGANNGCVTMDSVTVTVNPAPAPVTLTPAAPTVCLGSSIALSAYSGSQTGNIMVTGTSPTSSTSSSSPLYRTFEGSRRQYLVRASELTALGLIGGASLNSLSLNVTTTSAPNNFENFRVKMGATTANTMTAFATAPSTTVYTAASFSPVAGANLIGFTTPFVWDGISNVFVEFCFDNDPNDNCNAGSPTCWGNTPGVSVANAGFTAAVYYYADNSSGPRELCTISNVSGTSTSRPVMEFGFANPAITWSPVTGLFTDAATSVAYVAGTNAATVYAKPTGVSTYMITSTSVQGCATTSSATVNITPAPQVVTQPAATVSGCVGGTASFSVSATGDALTYQWLRNGVPVTGATSSTFTLNNLAYTDAGNFSVVVSGTCSPADTSDISVLSITDNLWTGSSNSDWNNPLNWCGGVPTAVMNVTIPSGTPFSPVIAGNAPVNNLTVNAGASLQVTASGRLKLHGNMTNNGTLNTTAGTIEFMGASNQTVPAITAANIIMNGAGGITLAGNMNIGTALTLTNGNITLGNNNLVMTGGTTGSVSSHIITNGSGKVTNNNVGSFAVVFPVGPTATGYNPVMISNGQGRNYTVGVVTGLPAAPALANGARAVNRTWNITVNTAPTSPVNIGIQYADADVNASATPTANMQAGVSNGSNWLIATPAAGVVPTGTAAGRLVEFQTVFFGPMVISNIGGINFPTAVTNIDADVTSIMLMPNIVDNMTVLRVKTLRTTKVEWTVIDGNGRVVMAFSKQVFAGQNDIQLSLGRLAAGSYQLVGQTSKGKVQSVQFVRL